MNRLILGALAAALLAVAGLGTVVWSQRGENATLRAAVHQQAARASAAESARKQADDALVSLRRKNAATAREMALLSASLEAALAENRAWADSPVPEGVRNALR